MVHYSKALPIVTSLAILSVLFFVGGPSSHSPRIFKDLWNFGHIFYFSLLPCLLIRLKRVEALQAKEQVLFILGLTATLGLIIEFLQSGLARSPDAGDMLRNMIGALVAIFFLLPVRWTFPTIIRKGGQFFTIVCIGLQCVAPGMTLLDEYRQWQDFPVLGQFDSRLELARWSNKTMTSIVTDPVDPDNSVMEVQLTTERYSRTGLNYFRRNWTGYTYFRFRVYNSLDSELELHCRIHDKRHQQLKPQRYSDRFNTSFKLPPGWNNISIPLIDIANGPETRILDLKQIYAVGIFVIQLQEPATIYIDDVHLH